MRICFFNRSYWPDFGATGQLLGELAEDLAGTHGCQVSVVAGVSSNHSSHGKRPSLAWREVHNGVEIVRARGTTFRTRQAVGRFANYVTYFLAACFGAFLVRRPDIVVALTDPPIIGLAAFITAKRCGGRFVFLCQDVFPEVAVLLEDFKSPLLNRCLDVINRFLLRHADRVIALGDAMRDRLLEKGADPNRVVVIHNWADCSAIVPGSKENAFARTHGLADRFVVMHSGNIGLSQNLDMLLDAAVLLQHYSGIVFVVVGDGVKRPALEARARAGGLRNVRFLPYQPKECLRDSFATADVFVVSLKAGLAGCIVPSKLYGILAAGRPFVASVEESSEVVGIAREFECGLVAEPGQPRDLAERILKLAFDRELADRMGANARRAGLLFDRRKQVQAYHDLFAALAREG